MKEIIEKIIIQNRGSIGSESWFISSSELNNELYKIYFFLKHKTGCGRPHAGVEMVLSQ